MNRTEKHISWLRAMVVVFVLLCGKGAWAQAEDSISLKIGQMILIGYPGTQVDPIVLEEIRAGKAGSIILFEKNVPKTSAAFTPLKKVIWTYQKAAPIPLLVTIDQEGGRVNRLKEKYGFTRSITAQEMGRDTTLDSVRFYGDATAATLAGLGINTNFAPVVDLGVNPENTVIYKVGRSFGANPDSVTRMAAAFIQMHRKYRVITTLKHFPGHGSSLADTHFGVADVTNTWTPAEMIPYERLITEGLVDAVMTSHIVNMKLDPKGYPGTLSSRMIDSLLRKQYHFNGVVFSDDMQMQAVAKQYGLEEAIRLAINAGVDILCFSNNIVGSEERTVSKVHSIIRAQVERGQIRKERIDESFRRIMKLKRSMVFNDAPVMGISPAQNQSTQSILQPSDTTSTPVPVKKEKKRKKKSKSNY